MHGLWGPLVRRIHKVAGVIYIVIGILCLTACISIAIGGASDASAGVDREVTTDINIDTGEGPKENEDDTDDE